VRDSGKARNSNRFPICPAKADSVCQLMAALAVCGSAASMFATVGTRFDGAPSRLRQPQRECFAVVMNNTASLGSI
jgi:hypothetical protein